MSIPPGVRNPCATLHALKADSCIGIAIGLVVTLPLNYLSLRFGLSHRGKGKRSKKAESEEKLFHALTYTGFNRGYRNLPTLRNLGYPADA